MWELWAWSDDEENVVEEEDEAVEEDGSSRTLHAKVDGDKCEFTRKRNPPSFWVLLPSNEILTVSSFPSLVVRSRYTCHFFLYQQCTRGPSVELSYTDFHAKIHGPVTTG